MLRIHSFPVISIDGIKGDHTDAATITPATNPVSVFCNGGAKSFFMRKTHAEPSVVPKNGSNKPNVSPFIPRI